jgi:hypothetical protein
MAGIRSPRADANGLKLKSFGMHYIEKTKQHHLELLYGKNEQALVMRIFEASASQFDVIYRMGFI